MRAMTAPLALSPPEARAALAKLPHAPVAPARFALLRGEGMAASAPRALLAAPSRAFTLAGCVAILDAPQNATALARLATALRQEVGRALQPGRGLAPVALVEVAGDAVRLTALAVWLDGAAAAPRALDAMQQIFHDSERWTAWALRPGRKRN